MFRILETQWLAPEIKEFHVEAARIARRQEPGQFVIVRVHERGERIPLTIADADPAAGSITLVVQGVGKTTKLMNTLEAGEGLLDVVGPLGRPSEIRLFGTVAVVAGGVGAAIAFPVARALRRAGNEVVAILGARTRSLVIFEDELRRSCSETHTLTDDGSYGERGLVTDNLGELLESGRRVDRVLAVGPVPMMQAVAELTKPRAVPTIVSLNSIMIDGTGMCGGCRVEIGAETRFACVDGPEFDAHQVNFLLLQRRNAMYRDAERQALERYEAALREKVPA